VSIACSREYKTHIQAQKLPLFVRKEKLGWEKEEGAPSGAPSLDFKFVQLLEKTKIKINRLEQEHIAGLV
jgi:hypothetical protein